MLHFFLAENILTIRNTYQLGQSPHLDLLLRHNIILMWLERRGLNLRYVFPGVPFTRQRVQERQKDYKVGKKETLLSNGPKSQDKGENKHEDLLDRFLQSKAQHPDHISDNEVRSLCLTMMFAGSETT